VTIFGVSWNALDLEHVKRFLRDAGPEPLLWEAKGTEIKPGEIREQVCGFANSHDGGYLVLGAEQREDASWALLGVEFPADPTTWVSDIVGHGGVSPYPEGLDTRAWPVADNRHVAVVWIPPTPTPPCNTRGTVYERVSGKTISVREPLRLAALFQRGDQAAELARTTADRGARWALSRLKGGFEWDGRHIQFGLGYAAAGYRPDLRTRLFTRHLEDQARSVIATVLNEDTISGVLEEPPAVGQGFRRFEVRASHRMGEWWSIELSWMGGISIGWRSAVNNTRVDLVVDGPLRRAYIAAVQFGEALGTQGSRYLRVAVAGAMFPPNPPDDPVAEALRPLGPAPGPVISRGPLVGDEHALDLAGVGRELNRAVGWMEYEPGFS
jgi:hypothetical protein